MRSPAGTSWVSAYSGLLAEKLGFDADFVENIGRVAALHDIGKVAVPELMIKLAGPYNRDQRLAMQMHTIYGARIIETMMAYSEKTDRRLVMACNIALHHYQTYNGKGYPRLKSNGTILNPSGTNYADYQHNAPLSGKDIPLEALIVGLADRYDALRSRRPYKEAFSHEKTLAVMIKTTSPEFPALSGMVTRSGRRSKDIILASKRYLKACKIRRIRQKINPWDFPLRSENEDHRSWAN